MVNQFAGSKTEPPQFTRGYGLAFGHGERKAMAMALVDRALRAEELGEEVDRAGAEQEFVLLALRQPRGLGLRAAPEAAALRGLPVRAGAGAPAMRAERARASTRAGADREPKARMTAARCQATTSPTSTSAPSA